MRKRLFVHGASGRQRYNVLGAVNPLTQELIRVCNQTAINSHTVYELWHKAMQQFKDGKLLLAFCWAHVRRDFVRVGQG